MKEKVEVLIKNNVIEAVRIHKSNTNSYMCNRCYFVDECRRTREQPCMSINRSDRNSVYYREKITK